MKPSTIKEFNLSNKDKAIRMDDCFTEGWFRKEDVKEFIRLIFEKINILSEEGNNIYDLPMYIERIAGDKLI